MRIAGEGIQVECGMVVGVFLTQRRRDTETHRENRPLSEAQVPREKGAIKEKKGGGGYLITLFFL